MCQSGDAETELSRDPAAKLHQPLPIADRVEVLAEECPQMLQKVLTHKGAHDIGGGDRTEVKHVDEVGAWIIGATHSGHTGRRRPEDNVPQANEHIPQFRPSVFRAGPAVQ